MISELEKIKCKSDVLCSLRNISEHRTLQMIPSSLILTVKVNQALYMSSCHLHNFYLTTDTCTCRCLTLSTSTRIYIEDTSPYCKLYAYRLRVPSDTGQTGKGSCCSFWAPISLLQQQPLQLSGAGRSNRFCPCVHLLSPHLRCPIQYYSTCIRVHLHNTAPCIYRPRNAVCSTSSACVLSRRQYILSVVINNRTLWSSRFSQF